MKTLIAFLALSTAAAAQVTVTGKVLYEDRPYTSSGFGGSVNRPVRQAKIDLLNSALDTILATGFTDGFGNYSLTFAGPDQDVKIRVYAQRATGKINAVVKNLGNAIYTVTSQTAVNTTASPFSDMVITQSGGFGGPFNIFDCAVKHFQYLASLEALPDTPPLMDIRWPVTPPDGTSFDGSQIHLVVDPPDTDEYDDDIIYHEMGHWTAFHYSKDDSPGGMHILQAPADPRLAWSEGWGHYWSAVVRQWSNLNVHVGEYSAPQIQVDLLSSFAPNWFDIEGPSFPSTSVMATNEVAIAAVLWDLVDTTNEPFDTLSGLEPDIWTAVSVRMKTMSNITLEDFHAGLMMDRPDLRLAVSGDPTTNGIFKDRLIRYYQDPSEPNDNPSGAPTLLTTLTLRTSYPAGDQDWYTVNAVPGTLVVQTSSLGDGADTVLQLWNAAGAMMLTSNDNRTVNDKSSQLTWSVGAATTYKVHVAQANPGNPIIEYGYYDISFTTLPATGGKKGGGGGCGLTGWEAVVLIGLVRRARRRGPQAR